MKFFKNSVFFLALIVNLSSFGSTSKNAESFEILAYDGIIKVSSPLKFSATSGVVITNETSNDFYVKIEDRPIVSNSTVPENEKDKVKKQYLTIKAHQTKGMELQFHTDRRIFLVPLAPSFQEIELLFGNKTYEIPDPIQRQ